MGSTKKTVKKPAAVASRAMKADAIALPSLRKLVDWFQRGRRILPWREEPSLYRVWISEIMLQQTQVITVVPYFDRFMKSFPTVGALARATSDDVMKAWAGLGYYSRARNLHAGARAIETMGFPQTKEAWLSIPGVGPYTAGAITSIALGLPEPIVDGNVERVFSRLRRLRRSEGDVPYKAALWELSRLAVESAHARGLSPSDLNQAWMELGATICTPRKPECPRCPIRSECEAFAAGEQELFPEKKKRAASVEMSESRVALVDLSRGVVYLEKAEAGQWRAGLWDFPELGGATKTVFVGAVGAIKKTDERLTTKHIVTHHKITRTLTVRFVDSRGAKMKALPGRWISMEEPEVGIGSAPKKGIEAIREKFV